VITVVAVVKAMGIEPTPDLTWSVGAIVREMWRAEHGGELPRKELVAKTNGAGSHCHAVYPKHWKKRISDVVKTHVTSVARQGSLF